MTEDQTIDMIDTSSDIELTADIVSAYVSNNSVPVGEVPDLIASVYRALKEIAAGAVASIALVPQEPAKRVVWVNL